MEIKANLSLSLVEVEAELGNNTETQGQGNKQEQKKADGTNLGAKLKIKRQNYMPHTSNESYLMLNAKSAKDEAEKELYDRMVRAAVRLHKMLPSVRGMTDEVCVLGSQKTLMRKRK